MGQNSDNSDHDNDENSGSSIATIEKNKTKEPKKYKVLLHNDDYTTMEFVVLILQQFFHKTHEEAQEIMLKVHREGKGVCGIYTFEVAESKADKVSQFARSQGYPLKCSIEEE